MTYFPKFPQIVQLTNHSKIRVFNRIVKILLIIRNCYIFWIVFSSILFFFSMVNAQKNVSGRRDWPRTRLQGVQLARMFINEDDRPLRPFPYGTGGQITIDHKMIARVVYSNRYRRSWFRSWIHVMHYLSPHVGKIKSATRHRHEWTSTLPSFGRKKPSGWIDCDGKIKKCDGNWIIYRNYWVKFRESVIKYWMSTNFAEIERNTGVKPRMWGNRQDVMRFLRKYRGLCVIGVGERNFFLARDGQGCSLDNKATKAGKIGKRSTELR